MLKSIFMGDEFVQGFVDNLQRDYGMDHTFRFEDKNSFSVDESVLVSFKGTKNTERYFTVKIINMNNFLVLVFLGNLFF